MSKFSLHFLASFYCLIMLLSLIQCQQPQLFTIATGISSVNTTRISNNTRISSNTTIQDNMENNSVIIIGNIVLILPIFFLSYLY